MAKRKVRRNRNRRRGRRHAGALVKGLESFTHKKFDICYRTTFETELLLAMVQGANFDDTLGVMFNYPGWATYVQNNTINIPAKFGTGALANGSIALKYSSFFGTTTVPFDEYRVKKLKVSVMPMQSQNQTTLINNSSATCLGKNPYIYITHDLDNPIGNAASMTPLSLNDPNIKFVSVVGQPMKWTHYITTPKNQAAPTNAWYDTTFTQAPYASLVTPNYGSVSVLESLGATLVSIPQLAQMFPNAPIGTYNICMVRAEWLVEFRGENIRS